MSPYLVKTSAGLAMLAGGLTAAMYSLYHLIRAGTCLSELKFIEDTSCFDNTGTYFEALPIGLVVAGVGLFLFAGRGAPPDVPTGWRGFRAGPVGWAAVLAASGFTLVWAVAGPDADYSGSAKTVGIVAGVLLIPLAIAPLAKELRAVLAARTGAAAGGVGPAASGYEPIASGYQPPQPAPTQPPAWEPTPRPPAPTLPTARPTARPSGGTTSTGIDRLNELARQRDSGAISPEEFERLKAEVLDDMTKGL
jgi:hypothetical protein